MNTTRRISVLVTILALSSAAAAHAQPPPAPQSPLGGKLSVDVNVGAQTRAFESTNDFTFSVYGQTATVSTVSAVDGGPMFDLKVGYRIVPQFGVAVGFSSFSKTGTAQGAASIPSPVFFNRPAAVTINPVDAQRSDRNVYVVVAAFLPLTDSVELSVFGGPSFTRVRQDLITSVTVPDGTQNVVSTIQSESGTAKGVNVGADISYMFTNMVGAGVFARYNGGSVDHDGASGVKAGGFQLGIGARLRF
jgi:hypothetical protein